MNENQETKKMKQLPKIPSSLQIQWYLQEDWDFRKATKWKHFAWVEPNQSRLFAAFLRVWVLKNDYNMQNLEILIIFSQLHIPAPNNILSSQTHSPI